MAAGPLTRVTDVVVPEIFTPYSQQLTEQKSNLVQGGALTRSAMADRNLAGGGLIFSIPSWQDLDLDQPNISSDDAADIIKLSSSGASPALPAEFTDAIPVKIETTTELAVRLSRNQVWSSAKLASALAGDDAMDAIAGRTATYWARHLQETFIAVWAGVIADNDANDSGDYTNDVSGVSYSPGVTNFTAEAYLDALQTMGDSSGELTTIMVNSIVRTTMKKNNLIDYIPDSRGETQIEQFQGLRVIEDDMMPNAAGVYETWMFGTGATQWGVGTPDGATWTKTEELAGAGGGQDLLGNRIEWTLHPTGHAYIGSPADGGPGNGTGANDFANAASWDRRYPERKQIPFARLVTREHA